MTCPNNSSVDCNYPVCNACKYQKGIDKMKEHSEDLGELTGFSFMTEDGQMLDGGVHMTTTKKD